MTLWDDRILELVREIGAGSPKMIEDTGLVRVSRQHISRRLNRLANYDLLTPLSNGIYTLTDEGTAYLQGDYDAEAGEFVEDMDEKKWRLPSETSSPL
ncbi:hypothetical protein [Halobacterium salinarum]|uniref:hypothetical protein n=1 Tax=Halobacterium salinarum TaxID=2242 RepID=UPI001F380192|nr:hypothetical protein [Halobacterium salinarum]MCF2165443.1 hypothetical protein [Halobacterium salinarum]MCF2168308.1 hypothetical protein [Halobacterium salinarum]